MTAPTLFGWPRQGERSPGNVEVLGVPSDSGNSIAAGARLGPAAVRRASLSCRTDMIGTDHGDLSDVHGCDWAEVLKRVQETVEAIYRRGSRAILLGGDHAISYAGVAAWPKPTALNVLWFDAHTDCCAWEGGDWHNHKQVLRRIAGLNHVGAVVQVGHRGITYFDEAAQFERITVLTARAAEAASAECLLALLPAEEPVYMSIDIDAVDPRWAPGTGHPVPGGLSVARLAGLARAVADNRHVVGLDMMEVNPLLDHCDMTSAAAAAILAEIVPALARPSPSRTVRSVPG
jgi:agmatinase